MLKISIWAQKRFSKIIIVTKLKDIKFMWKIGYFVKIGFYFETLAKIINSKDWIVENWKR